MNKQDLFKTIRDGLHAMGGRQVDIAEKLSIGKQDVTRMMRQGAEDSCSVEKAMAVLGAMGVRVTFQLERCEPFHTPGRYGNKVQERLAAKKANDEATMQWIAGVESDCPQ